MGLLSIGILTPLIAMFFGGSNKKEIPIQAPPLQTPSVTIGSVIPVLFGTRMINGSNIVWWGDMHIIMKEMPQGSGAKW